MCVCSGMVGDERGGGGGAVGWVRTWSGVVRDGQRLCSRMFFAAQQAKTNQSAA